MSVLLFPGMAELACRITSSLSVRRGASGQPAALRAAPGLHLCQRGWDRQSTGKAGVFTPSSYSTCKH
ncbi:hypothetical protein GGI35DRAFT_20694 [Trichoderma velutinum]